MTAEQYLKRPYDLKKKAKTYRYIADCYQKREDEQNRQKFLEMAQVLEKEADEKSVRIMRLLRRVHPLYADALKYRYLLGLTLDEVAGSLNYTKRHTTRLIQKGLAQVERHICRLMSGYLLFIFTVLW